MHPPELSAVVTNFRRPKYLERCLDSLVNAGLTRISVFSMSPTPEVNQVIDKFKNRDGLDFRFNYLPNDLGLHECWGLCSYYADTKYVCLVHDDDGVSAELGNTYTESIYPQLQNGVGFASWRANLMFDNGRFQNTEYWHGPTRIMPSNALESFLLRPNRLSLSPIISVFNRETLIHSIKEGSHALTDYLHPGMLLGTEVLAYLRHCSTYEKWFYVDKIMSHYGAHDGSGTVKYQKSNNIARLARGYDSTRSYYTQHKNNKPAPDPKLILVSAPFESSDENERARIANARITWQFHLNHGTMLDFPLREGMLTRSSKDLGDSVAVPFLRDALDHGAKFAMPEDVIGFANCDLGFTTRLPELVIPIVKQHGVCVVWRRTMSFNPAYPLRTCKNGLKDGGCDSVFVSKEWWKENRDKIPDLVLGACDWDYVFRIYAERATDGRCYLEDSCIHHPHESFYKRNRLNHPRQRHNHELAKQFFSSIGMHKAVEALKRNT